MTCKLKANLTIGSLYITETLTAIILPNGRIVACSDRECHVFAGNKSQETITLNSPRRYPAISVINEDSIIITGGLNASNNLNDVSSAEIVSSTTLTASKLPDLPKPLSMHCMARINKTTLMALGGSSGLGHSSETFFYLTDKKTWIIGPTLIEPRCDFLCGVLNDSTIKGIQIMVVTGGYDNPTTAILPLNHGPLVWQTIDYQFPKPLPWGSSMVTTSDGKNLILVSNEKIFKFGCTWLECKWQPMVESEKLDHAKNHILALRIPDEIVDCVDHTPFDWMGFSFLMLSAIIVSACCFSS